MGKSSSSSRRKNRSKASSQGKKKKRSKIRSRKRESKKLRHHISDDDDSRSLTSGSYSYSSSSSDEDKYRSRSSRIRTQKDVKSSKKTAKKRSYTSESSEGSPHVRKRKGLKRKRDYESKKKIYSKKKRRRDYSTSSTSRGSSSCSTCQGDGSSSHEVEFERHRSKHGLEERDERYRGDVESPSKSRYRSRSPPCSRFSGSTTYQNEEKVSVENNSRRLRSVIIVAKKDTEEERELFKDEDKEEIIHVHGDYPPCRSNDSNDVGNKWEEDDHSPHDEMEKMRLRSEKRDDTAVSDLRNSKHAKSGNVSKTDDGSQFEGSNTSFNESGTTNIVNDLESVLRQKALENLRRFRCGLQTGERTANQKDKGEGDVKQSSVANVESLQTKSSLEGDTRVVGAKFSQEDGALVSVSTETQSGQAVRVLVAGKATTSSQSTCANESVSTKQTVACLTRQTTIADNSKEKVSTGISVVQPKLTTLALRRHLSEIRSTPKQALEPKEPQEKLSLTKSSSDRTAAVTAPPVTQNSNNNDAGVNKCSSAASEASSLKSASVETSSDKLQNEAHEGTQLERKTMSVMRGGEMVKVSYNVYIPKKVPALARRQLRR